MVLGIVSLPRFKIELADIRQAVGLVHNCEWIEGHDRDRRRLNLTTLAAQTAP